MIDKELIKQEIERRYNCEKCYPLDRESNVAAAVLQEMLLFIDSLPEEPASEDLEEYAKKLAKGAALDKHNLIWMCKKGAEWQKNQMKEALQTEYEKGRFDMREEIMKDAVDAVIFSELKGNDGSLFQAKSDRFKMNDVKISDRIKAIPIKTEQQ